MKIKIRILQSEYEITTTSNEPDGFIKVEHETGVWPRSYFEKTINGGYGVYGKIITMDNLTNLDLIAILDKKDMLISYEPEIKTNSQESYEQRRAILWK